MIIVLHMRSSFEHDHTSGVGGTGCRMRSPVLSFRV